MESTPSPHWADSRGTQEDAFRERAGFVHRQWVLASHSFGARHASHGRVRVRLAFRPARGRFARSTRRGASLAGADTGEGSHPDRIPFRTASRQRSLGEAALRVGAWALAAAAAMMDHGEPSAASRRASKRARNSSAARRSPLRIRRRRRNCARVGPARAAPRAPPPPRRVRRRRGASPGGTICSPVGAEVCSSRAAEELGSQYLPGRPSARLASPRRSRIDRTSCRAGSSPPD